jgi:hypothetical protein
MATVPSPLLNNGLVILEETVNKLGITVSDIVATISAFPSRFVGSSKDTADHIAGKIEEYRKVIKGENQNEQDELFYIKDSHADFLDRMRSDNPNLYCMFVQLIDCYNNMETVPKKYQYLKCGNQSIVCPVSSPKNVMIMITNIALIFAKGGNRSPIELQRVFSFDRVLSEQEIYTTFSV